MSPIYIRPAREQAEHDRLILFLEAQSQKKFEVLINKGDSRDFALKIGAGTYFPDLILQQAKKPVGVIEIETGESTNKLEALAQWVHFGKARIPFHLYVPVLMYDAARRFCEQHQVTVSEIWTYRPLFEGFDLVRVFHDPQAVGRSGKGPAAKVVTMPKMAEAPKPQPAIEAVEEILARIGSREAAKQASREAARLASRARASRPSKTGAPPAVVPAQPATVTKPAAKPAPKPVAAPAVKPAAKPSKAAKPVKPAKPMKQSSPVKPVKKGAAPAKKPVKKAPPAPAAKSGNSGKSKKVVARKVASKKTKPVSRAGPKPKTRAKKR